MRPLALSAVFLLTTIAHFAVAASFTPEQVTFFKEEVRPLLETNCVKCHGGVGSDGAVKIRSEFQIISRLGIVQGGALGTAYNEAEPEDSLLLHMISYKDEEHEMPPSGKLEDAEIETLTNWVKMGMPWTPEDADKLHHIEEEDSNITEINDFTKSYWSYKALERPAIPEVGDAEWQKHPIDAFIYAKLKENGLNPNEEASARILARRAHHNVTGLPPSPEEVEAFSKNYSESSWVALVDRLLESPHYGEKWARHWLDIVRYAESNGFERDSKKEFIWRYRDYVIEALNSDKPYDQFIREQLAGDELEEVTSETLIATGYHRLMQWDDEPADRPQHVYDVLDDNVRITSEGFLGMTLGCARCHDHKGDPISQKDYYSFMAFFHGVTQMDKNRVIENIDVALPDEAQKKRIQELADRQEKLANQLRALEKKAKAALAKLEPDHEALKGTNAVLPHLISTSRDQPQAWQYSTHDPGEGWSEVGFRPKGWKEGLAPFGRDRKARTKWKTKDIWLQKTFGLTSLPSDLTLHIRYDDDVEVYLNGQLVYEEKGPISDYKTVSLGKDAVTALQTGRNVVAVHVRQKERGQFIDLGLEAAFGGQQLAELIKKHEADIFTKDEVRHYRDWRRQLEQVRREAQQDGLRAMIVQEHGTTAKPMYVHRRGSVHAPGEEVPPAFPSIFGGEVPEIPEPGPYAKSTGRRKVLADWIVKPDNPRTSRIMMNRLWQHHFGRGICASPSDFGFLGEKATHPELLDWLASEFVAQGWSLKAMHRLIMTSKTYRMSSQGSEVALNQDPQNLLFWRYGMRRLSAEEIRDGMLSVTGRLNPKRGGPSFYPTLPPEVLATSSTGAGKWGKSSPEEQARRSIYITIKRSLKPPELTDFDFADTDAPCSARFVTTVPIQALAMLNSKVVNDHAKHLAERLREEVKTGVRDQVARGLALVTCRPPKDDEIDHCVSMIETFEEEHGLSANDALDRFCLLALNLNEFVYLD